MTNNAEWTPKPNTWTHQLVKNGDVTVIAEVYYNKEGKPFGFASRAPEVEDVEDMSWLVEQYRKALTKPILDADKDFDNDV